MQVKEDRRVVRFRFDCELSRKSIRDDHCGAAMISAKPVSYQSIIKSLSFLYGLSLPVTSLRFVVLALHGSDLVEGFPPSRHCTYKVLACSQPARTLGRLSISNMPGFINDNSEHCHRDGGAAGLGKYAATDQQLGQKVQEGEGQGCSLQFRCARADAAMSDKQSAMSHGLLSCWPETSCCRGLCARAWVGL